MKKIKIFSFLLSAMLMLVSCQEEEKPNLGRDTQWLQFGEETYSVAENSPEPLVVTVYYGAENNPDGVTVNYTVSSESPDRFELLQEGSVQIPAGEFSADILVEPINNFETDGDAEIVLELSSDSEVPVGIAGEGVYNASTLITVIDDDCPIDIESFVGTYSVSEQFTSGTNSGLKLSSAFGERYQVELALLPGDVTGTKMVITNSSGFNTYFANGTVITFNTCTQTITFDGGNPAIANFARLAYTSSSYDENTLQVTASGPLGNYGPYQFLLTKIQTNEETEQ